VKERIHAWKRKSPAMATAYVFQMEVMLFANVMMATLAKTAKRVVTGFVRAVVENIHSAAPGICQELSSMVAVRLVDVAISTRAKKILIRRFTVLIRRFDLKKAANALTVTNALL